MTGVQTCALPISIAIAAKWLWDHGLGWLWNKMKELVKWLAGTFMRILKKVVDMIGSAISKVANFSAKVGHGITSFGNKVLGSKAVGGTIPQTGLYRMHQGEVVIPSQNSTHNGLTLIIEGNVYGTDPDDIAEALQNKLDTKIST